MLDVSSAVGLADVGFASPGAVGAGAVIYQETTIDATLGGASLEDIISLKISEGWDQPLSTAEMVLRTRPASGDYMDPVTIIVNGVLRWVGVMADNWDSTGFPETVVLHGKDELTKAEQFKNQTGDLDPEEGQPGLTLDILLGAPTGTLKQIVMAVLDICGVAYDPGNFADPPHVYGLEAPEEFTWRLGETGLTFLHRLFEASAGYRLFHSGGQLYLSQIIGRPRDADVGMALVWGTDILDGARATRDKSRARNGVTIKGYDDGAGLGPLQVDVVEANYPWSPGAPLVDTVSSSLVEDEVFAAELADYWLQELNREIWTASVPTWREDVMGLGQTVLLDATDELKVGEPGWVTGHQLEVTERGEFTQTLQLLGGGLPG